MDEDSQKWLVITGFVQLANDGRNGWKLLEWAENGCKWLYMVGMTGNRWKLLEIAGMVQNGGTCLEKPGIAKNGLTWLEMDALVRKKLAMA